MLHKIISGISIIYFSMILPSMVGATSIPEAEGNDTFIGAQQLFGSNFSTGANSDIFMAETIPWVSITSSSVNTNSYDYYSFTIKTDTTGYFDIDNGYTGSTGSADTVLTLFDSDFEEILIKDDADDVFLVELYGKGAIYQSGQDEGSNLDTAGFDPSFSYEFATGGTYYLLVSLYNWDQNNLANSSPLELAQFDSYTLQVSLDPAPVPEPTTMILFGTGLVGLMGSRIRRKKKA